MSDSFRARLRDILYKGVAPDIYLGERAREVHRCVGRHADAVNASGFGEFFGTVQNSAVGDLTLAVAKLFERPSKRNKLRSIPAALDLLAKHPGELSPIHEGVAAGDLALLGIDQRVLAIKSGPEYTAAFAAAVIKACPDPEKAADCELSTALEALRTRRDKAVAHNEAIELGSLPLITWREAERLLAFAKSALGAVSITFLGTAFTADDGAFIGSGDAQVAGIQLERLLQKANIIPMPRPANER